MTAFWKTLVDAASVRVAPTASAGDDGAYAFTLGRNEGTPKKPADDRRKALLLAKTAIRCGFAKPYTPMERLSQT